jgi:UDP-glucose 4-epimerase
MKVIITGGAGFIGSNIVRKIASSKLISEILIIDNLSSGSLSRIESPLGNKHVQFFQADLQNQEEFEGHFKKCDLVIHLAANPDISKAEIDPSIDFWQGTYLTQNLLDVMKANSVKQIIYISGSGVYGEIADFAFKETFGPNLPLSTYGASKLACEALLSSYAHLFGIKSRILRLANVVGPQQTHGITYDLIRKLRQNPKQLQVLGDGNQVKSYLYVSDVVSAIEAMIESMNSPICCDVFNVSTADRITVREIVEIVCDKFTKAVESELKPSIGFDSQPRGWKADVPNIKLDSSKIQSLGWTPRFTSSDAINLAVDHALLETEDGNQ